MTIKPISKNNIILKKGDECIFEPEKKNYINLTANEKVIIERVFDNGVVCVDNNSGIMTNVYANQLNKKTLDQQFTEETGIDVFQKKRGINLDPVIGMGVTRSIGSDSYPFTIIDILNVKDKTILKIERDHSEYEHNAPYKAREKEIEYLEQYIDNRDRTSYKDIKWNEETKRWNKGCSYYYASIGQRHYDLDRSF